MNTWYYGIAMVLLAAAACVGEGTGLDSFGNRPGGCAQQVGSGSGDSVTLSGHVQPILTINCALAGCHAGTQPQQGMNLSAGLTHANVVNVPSVELPGMPRVCPSQADSSYLVHKVQGTHASVGGIGDRMPLGGAPLTAAEIARIRGWILLGAKNN